MRVKLALLLFVALMLPGLAVAQTAVFYTGIYPMADASDTPDVDATLSCNNGIPLEQTATVGVFPAGAVAFTITDVVLEGDATCTVTFSNIPSGWELWRTFYEVDVYEYEYDFNYSEAVCTFSPSTAVGVQPENYCALYIMPSQLDFEVTVNWNVTTELDPGVGHAQVRMICEDVVYPYSIGSEGYLGVSSVTSYALTSVFWLDQALTLSNFRPNPNGNTVCYAEFWDWDAATEVDSSGCYGDGGAISVDVGDDTPSCTIAATIWYEGIPTLSQYGMAIMVLLVLGVGFVSFRRFA